MFDFSLFSIAIILMSISVSGGTLIHRFLVGKNGSGDFLFRWQKESCSLSFFDGNCLFNAVVTEGSRLGHCSSKDIIILKIFLVIGSNRLAKCLLLVIFLLFTALFVCSSYHCFRHSLMEILLFIVLVSGGSRFGYRIYLRLVTFFFLRTTSRFNSDS